MATPVVMPKQGQSVESCLITKWYKKPGDRVRKGDLLFSYETDKASFEEEAETEGVLLAVFFSEGEEVPVMTTVGVIGEEGEDAAEFDPRGRDGKTPAEEGKETTPGTAGDASPPPEAPEQRSIGDKQGEREEERIKISPRARNLAAQRGVDYRRATPTGPQGRIIARDIAALSVELPGAEAPPPQAGGDFEEVEFSSARKLIARRMHASLSESAQVTLHTSFDASSLIALRKEIKKDPERLGHITFTDMIVYAVARTIRNYPELNAHILGDKLRLFRRVHLGVAVDTERGLLVPTLFDADRKTLVETAVELKRLAKECREGTINPDYLTGAGFTITNLGALGIESFTPVINPPQTGILGVNAITWRIKEDKGEYLHYPAMGLSLTFDHRALDGAPAARFLQELKENLEKFIFLLCK